MVRPYGIHVSIFFEVDGRRALDESLVKLLLLIDEYGSILAAARAMRLPYSRAWESITRAESLLGVRLVESKRGSVAGGTKLTKECKELINEYLKKYKRFTGEDFRRAAEREFRIPDLTYMGSHDPGVEILSGIIRSSGILEDIELSWVGSGLGLMALSLGEADVVGAHLYDPETGTYNVPYLRKYLLQGRSALIKGYEREIGFVTSKEFRGVRKLIKALIDGEITLINRQPGSGTRTLLDYLLIKFSKNSLTPLELSKAIKGYGKEVNTHTEVVKSVALGEAEAGLCIRWAAQQYNLRFISIGWERFDFITLRDELRTPGIKAFLDTLRSEEFIKAITELPGYRIPEGYGVITYI